MPNWSQSDVDLRNIAVFGDSRPDGPATLQEKPAEDVRESLIQMECTRFLQADGWRALQTSPVSNRGRATGFGEVGMCDHLYLRPRAAEPYCCDVLWCEFKSANKKAKKHQRAWHAVERARGFSVWVANETFPATVEGFREHYARSGLMRRVRWW